MPRKLNNPSEMRFIAPKMKHKVGRQKRTIFEDEFKKLKNLCEHYLSRAELQWSSSDWKKKAGIYADVQAFKRYVIDEDIFELGDEEGKLLQGVEESYRLAGRFFNLLTREGADTVLGLVVHSSEMDAAWQIRSGTDTEIAQVLGMGY